MSKLKIPQIPTPSVFSNTDNSSCDELLKDLGLYPLPKNVKINISSDNRYLNLKLKDENVSVDDHLLFQIPLKDKDLSALEERNDCKKLKDRYNTYTESYIKTAKEYAIQERKYIQEKFPDLVFTIKIRIKSYESYLNKINQKIELDESPYIKDIMAERIILSSIGDCQDEEKLTQMCYEVAEALYEFRKNTQFRMMSDNINNKAQTTNKYITKDYIAYPKENGYQSLHILMQNKDNSDLMYETQIRTFKMEEASKNNNKISHKEYKPRILNDLSDTRIPSYFIITKFNDSSGNPIIIDLPPETGFYHFYNNTIGSTDNYKKGKTITYKKYKEELSKLTKALGMPFEVIREKLRKIDISKHIKNNDSGNLEPDL